MGLKCLRGNHRVKRTLDLTSYFYVYIQDDVVLVDSNGIDLDGIMATIERS